MYITMPFVVPLKTDFTNPKRYFFKADEIGNYSVDLDQVQRQLLDVFQSLQGKGWIIQSVTSIQGGVYHYQTNSGGSVGDSWAWGYGWGTSATEGLLLILTRAIDDQFAERWVEAMPALDAFRKACAQRSAEVRPKLDELTGKRTALAAAAVKPIKQGVIGMRKVAGYSLLSQEYDNEAQAAQAKQQQLAQLDWQISQLEAVARQVSIEQYLRPDQIAVINALMPDASLVSQCFNGLVKATLGQ